LRQKLAESVGWAVIADVIPDAVDNLMNRFPFASHRGRRAASMTGAAGGASQLGPKGTQTQ
jgi:hypothetical protein